VKAAALPAGRPAVLFVSVPTGIGGSTRSLATVLSHVGDDAVRILAGPRSGRFVELVRQNGVELHLPIVASGRLRPVRRAWTAARLAAFAVRHRHQLAAIHANGLKELSLSLPAAVVSRVPLVVWVHNFAVPPSVRLFGWLWRAVLPRCDVRWAAVSPLARDIAVGAHLTAADDVVIVPNPIDPDDVVATERQASDTVSVAYLGAPRRYKGFDLLPDIIEESERLATADWLVFSHQTDDDLDSTWQRLRKMAEDGRVSLEGKFPDVRVVYARCDVVVCPSVLESFCRVAAEAMLNGIPVVGSDLAPIRALLGEDEAGLLFPVGDSRRAADAIARLVADDDLRARLGAAGRRRAAPYNPASVRQQLLALYGIADRTNDVNVDENDDAGAAVTAARTADQSAPGRAAPHPAGGRHRRAPTNAPGPTPRPLGP
jgi:glycosyltransferase involved in cell wall biosynthesis